MATCETCGRRVSTATQFCECEDDKKSAELRDELAKAIARELIEQMARVAKFRTVHYTGNEAHYSTHLVLEGSED
jgi:formamidopyrimidine-DNA glycosylase